MLPALVAVVHPLVSKMDFQFTHYQGNVSVKCSMEHIALANWFNTEVRSNPKAILTHFLLRNHSLKIKKRS